jgi:hypothetical protein
MATSIAYVNCLCFKENLINFFEWLADGKLTCGWYTNGWLQGQNGRNQDAGDIPLEKCGHYDRFQLRLTGAQVGGRVEFKLLASLSMFFS